MSRWEDRHNRTPRWRASLTIDRVRRTIEALEHFITMKNLQEDPRYKGDLDYFKQTLDNFDSLIPERAASNMLLFDDWLKDSELHGI